MFLGLPDPDLLQLTRYRMVFGSGSFYHQAKIVKKNQCYRSGMFIPDPDFTHPSPGSLIPDQKTATK
jgi:hypothetical protein